jgi:phage regulator Rha-like protein
VSVALVAAEVIAERIFIVRGQKVILDTDLAALYEVPTKQFNQAVKRNLAKFPADFMFALTAAEWEALRSQFVTLNNGRGQHRKYLPYVFTEHGAIMAATLLNSPRAVEVSVYVVRAFVQLREFLASNKDLARQLRVLEQRIEKKLTNHDQAIADVVATLKQLMSPANTTKRRIGFVIDEDQGDKDDKKSRGNRT